MDEDGGDGDEDDGEAAEDCKDMKLELLPAADGFTLMPVFSVLDGD